MPRETVSPRTHGTERKPTPAVVVRWDTGEAPDVVIGLEVQTPETPSDSFPHLIAHFYGEAPTLTKIGVEALTWAQQFGGTFPDFGNEDEKTDYACAVGQGILDMVIRSGDQMDQSWWTVLDRRGINRLIVVLRKARDRVFGRDE